MNSDFFYFCLLLLVSSLSFGFVMVCLDGNSAIRVGSQSPLYRELVRREFVKRTFRIVLVACAMLACMAMLFRNAPSGWFDAAQRQPKPPPTPEGQATNGSKPAAGEKAQAEGSAIPQSGGQGSAKTADEQRSGGSGEKRGKRSPSDLALDFCEFLLAILAISLAFKNFRIGNENPDTTNQTVSFGVGSFLTIVSAVVFALLVHRIPLDKEILSLSFAGVISAVPIVVTVGILWRFKMAKKNYVALAYLGLWAGCLISRWDRAVLVNGNSSDDRTSRVLGAVLLVGASCLFLTRMSKVQAQTSSKRLKF
jgi:hypothetical protein